MLKMRGKVLLACLVMAALTACQTVPADYAASLSQQDPRWGTEACRQMRADASRYGETERNAFPMSTGVLLGPYGVGIALAGMEHREEMRKQFARELHTRCSSLPIPDRLAPKQPVAA